MAETKRSSRRCGIPGLGLTAVFGVSFSSPKLHFLTCVYRLIPSMHLLTTELAATTCTPVTFHRFDDQPRSSLSVKDCWWIRSTASSMSATRHFASVFVALPIFRYSYGVRAQEHLALLECLHVRVQMRA